MVARPTDPEHLVVGHVAKLHGTKGEVFVWPLTDRPDAVFAPGRRVVVGDAEGEPGEEPETLEVEASRPFKRGLLVKFAGLEDRNAAEPLARRYLLMPLSELEPLEEGEVYYHQLLGMEVVKTDGTPVGRVRELYETEPASLLEVKGVDGKIHLIPFSERVVTEVDTENGRLVIEPPPGLLEL